MMRLDARVARLSSSRPFYGELHLSMTYAKWLRQQLSELDNIPDDVAGEHLAAIIAEAERRAADAGLPAAVEACQIRPGPVGVDLARRVLAECLAACPDESKDLLNPSDVAELLSVSPATVAEWIESDQLKASNLSKSMRPRWVIHRPDLDRFLEFRQG